MSNLNTPRAFQRLLATGAGWGPLALRLPIGAIFVAYILLHLSLIGTLPWRQMLGSQFVVSEFMEQVSLVADADTVPGEGDGVVPGREPLPDPVGEPPGFCPGIMPGCAAGPAAVDFVPYGV